MQLHFQHLPPVPIAWDGPAHQLAQRAFLQWLYALVLASLSYLRRSMLLDLKNGLFLYDLKNCIHSC